MSQVDVGSQRIGWKYSTPLQSDYLNTFSAGLFTPGLLTRPRITMSQPSAAGVRIVISPFSILVVPTDKKSNEVSVYNKTAIFKLVKITTTTEVSLTITDAAVGIGLKYSFSTNEEGSGTLQSQWYADIIVVDKDEVEEFYNKGGLFIATCQCRKEGESQASWSYAVTTEGADISDALLSQEGRNPNCWLSLVHPIRSQFGSSETWGIFNRLEVRSHNDLYSGFINGNKGFKKLENLTYQIPQSSTYDPPNYPGVSGQFEHRYNLFRLQSDGFDLAESSDTLPIPKTSGGIFAMVDAVNVIGPNNLMPRLSNNLMIYPVQKEDINVYFDPDDGNTLFIR